MLSRWPAALISSAGEDCRRLGKDAGPQIDLAAGVQHNSCSLRDDLPITMPISDERGAYERIVRKGGRKKLD